ncbi:MAG TPA: PqqD family protein [Acidimicrobiales bacterium]|nr:PqqD family protein [Acidimicrobiales bacterium]
MRRRADVISREVDGRVVALDLGSSRYYSVNSSGAALWELLEGEVGADEMADALVERFGIDRSQAVADVATFLEDLRSSGLIED